MSAPRLLRTMLGCYPIWVTLPIILLCYRSNELLRRPESIVSTILKAHTLLSFSVYPIAVFLSFPMIGIVLERTRDCTLRGIVWRGIFFGPLLASLNFMAWAFIGELIARKVCTLTQGILIVPMIGALWGAWAGLNAWQAVHPEKPVRFRFSLRTLLIFVLIVGVVMAFYRPDPNAPRLFGDFFR